MANETFKNSLLSLSVPDGWKVFDTTDIDGNKTDKKIFVYKNAEDPLHIFSRAGITLCYFSKRDIYLSPKRFYENVEDIAPLELGNYLWEGYTCTSVGYPYTMLEAHKDGTVLQLMMLMENNGERISLSDPDVREMIGSIKSLGEET